MKALITGASSGIGREYALALAKMGYDLVITARRADRLEQLKSETKNVKVDTYVCNLTDESECKKLYESYPDIDVLINNAGFGVFGEFTRSDLERELEMINVNIKSVHILTKLYLQSMTKRNSGYILNVASSAAFAPGPLFSSYYASKAYIFRLTRAIAYELKKSKSKTTVSVLCPGPVDTEFNSVAGVNFAVGSITAKYAAEYSLKKLFKKKTVIVPSFTIKLMRFLSKICPEVISQKITYRIQKAKL